MALRRHGRRLAAAAMLAVAAGLAFAAPAPAPAGLASRYQAPDPNLVAIMQVKLDGSVINDALTAYQDGSRTFLPLGEMARLLSLAIKVQGAEGTASGFVLREDQEFHVNLERASAALGPKSLAVDPARIRLQDDDIYVESALLATWLPVNFEIDMASLTVTARPRVPLPLQQRIARERAPTRDVRRGYIDPGYPRLPHPYRIASLPLIDQTLAINARRDSKSRSTDLSSTTLLAADVLGMQGDAYLLVSDKTFDARLTLARHDPDATLLGPLQARTVVVGSDVTLPIFNHLGSGGLGKRPMGVGVSNRPFAQSAVFDRTSLTGPLPADWDVQLFYNNALIAYQAARSDGRYEFNDLMLAYGENSFRLVFHGPNGQVRVEQQSFFVDQSSTPDGAFYYQFAARDDDIGGRRVAGQFEWGLGRAVSLSGGVMARHGVPYSIHGQPGWQPYAQLNAHAFLKSMILYGGLTRGPDGHVLNEFGLKTRVAGVSVSASQVRPNGLVSDMIQDTGDRLKVRSQLQLDGMVRLASLRLPFNLSAKSDARQSGKHDTTASVRLSAQLGGLSLSNQLALTAAAASRIVNGTFQLSQPIGDTSYSAQLLYETRPKTEISSALLTVNRRLGDGYTFNFNLSRAMATRDTQAMAALNRNFGKYSLGLTANYGTGGVLSLGARLFMAMGYEPRHSSFSLGPMPQQGASSASVRVYLDKNDNGVMDKGDEPLRNIGVTINGARNPARTDAAGIAYVTGLPVKQHVDLAIDPFTVEDPYWAPRVKGVRFLARQGSVMLVDMPIHVTGEVDGTVYLADPTVKQGRRPIGDVILEVRDKAGALAATVTSASDGYFLALAIPPGDYLLNVQAEQARRLGWRLPQPVPVHIDPEGSVMNGLDFVLHPQARR